MDIATESASSLRGLRERFGDWILVDAADLERYRTDWGRWLFRTPGAVARPRTTEQVAELVRWCREHGVTITPRAQGHSQSGQSTNEGGVVLDITAMDTIHAIDRQRYYDVLRLDQDQLLELVLESIELGMASSNKLYQGIVDASRGA